MIYSDHTASLVEFFTRYEKDVASDETMSAVLKQEMNGWSADGVPYYRCRKVMEEVLVVVGEEAEKPLALPDDLRSCLRGAGATMMELVPTVGDMYNINYMYVFLPKDRRADSRLTWSCGRHLRSDKFEVYGGANTIDSAASLDSLSSGSMVLGNRQLMVNSSGEQLCELCLFVDQSVFARMVRDIKMAFLSLARSEGVVLRQGEGHSGSTASTCGHGGGAGDKCHNMLTEEGVRKIIETAIAPVAGGVQELLNGSKPVNIAHINISIDNSIKGHGNVGNQNQSNARTTEEV
jgi:hypothetical protein